MSEHENEKLLDHDYDGIKELDNTLPTWWLGLFYATIVFAVIYMAYYHVLGIGYNQYDEYEKSMNASYVREGGNPLTQLMQVGYHSPLYSPKRDNIRNALLKGQSLPKAAVAVVLEEIAFDEPLTDAESITAGKAIYTKTCAVCHGQEAQGVIGPNMTDNYWIHGDAYSDTVRIVVDGVIEKGMQSWRKQLTPQQIHEVTSYMYTLRGTSPPNPKAPEGKQY